MQHFENILRVENLTTSFQIEDQWIPAINDISFEIPQGKCLGIIGESGCGKSVTSFSILQLLPHPIAKITAGTILFNNKNLLTCSKEELRKIRGNEISMIFQEPMTSLNPVMTIGEQLIEIFLYHKNTSKKEATLKSIEFLKLVGLTDPENRFYNYPHQLSGGMKQRVMIAMALLCQPKLLIADEPTTALDVTIQAQILTLLKKLQSQFQMSVLMITHDLSVIAQTTDHVLVMYAGKIVEKADVIQLFQNPMHPYTKGLLNCVMSFRRKNETLSTIEGQVPQLQDIKKGCVFYSRCSLATQQCKDIQPPLTQIKKHHFVACHHLE